MRSEFAVLGLLIIAGLSAHLRAQDATGSVWDGVYTRAQADRGRSLYNASCGSCHGEQLNGGEIAPPLAGGEFLSNWNGLTVGQLFERTRTGMPPGAPGKVPRDAKVDIVAYVLSSNGFPAGERELPSQTAMMNTIRIDAEKPKR